MQAIERALNAPRVKAARIRLWFGLKKAFPRVEQLPDIVEHGAPVHVEGSADIGAALASSNRRSVAPHSDAILAKIFDDVRFGRPIIFPRSEAYTIPDLRVSPSKTRIIHDLPFLSSQYARSVNADTDFAQPPSRRVGSSVAKYYWAHLVFASSFLGRTHA